MTDLQRISHRLRGYPSLHRRLPVVKRFSPLIILGALAAFFLFRRREADLAAPDSAWSPVDPS